MEKRGFGGELHDATCAARAIRIAIRCYRWWHGDMQSQSIMRILAATSLCLAAGSSCTTEQPPPSALNLPVARPASSTQGPNGPAPIPYCDPNEIYCLSYNRVTCVDSEFDEANCGECGNSCSPGEVCFAGECVFDASAIGEPCDTEASGAEGCKFGNAEHYGDGCCPEGDEAICRDIRWDPLNCGRCGNKCSENELCEAGKCMRREGAECDPSEAPADTDLGGTGQGVCYTGRSAVDTVGWVKPDEDWARARQVNIATQLDCCDTGEGTVCVNVASEDNCGSCGNACNPDGPNRKCVAPLDGGPMFCGCEWLDRPRTALSGIFEEGFQQWTCPVGEADSCFDNIDLATYSGDPDRTIGCGCGDGPACVGASTCTSGQCQGCTLNSDCPYAQLCNTSGPIGVCEVVGCDASAGCVNGANSSGISFASDLAGSPVGGAWYRWAQSVPQGGINPAVLRCVTNADLQITTPPSGYAGFCVDESTDPAYCGSPANASGNLLATWHNVLAASPLTTRIGIRQPDTGLPNPMTHCAPTNADENGNTPQQAVWLHTLPQPTPQWVVPRTLPQTLDFY